MKTQKEIEAKITELERNYVSVLTGTFATVVENAPRALQQADAETTLRALHWTLGTKYVSKLKPQKR